MGAYSFNRLAPHSIKTLSLPSLHSDEEERILEFLVN